MRIRMRTCVMGLATAAWLGALNGATAATVPFTEDFPADSAGWKFDPAGAVDSTWASSGGPDGGAHVTQAFNFANSGEGDTPVLFRAHDEFNSSGSQFVGDWIADGVTQFSIFVRHNAPTPVSLFTRFATPVNFPGAAAVSFVPTPPDVWTQVTFEISSDSPAIVYEGPMSTFASVFGNVGHVQIGLSVPAALAGLDQEITFQLDKPTIVPEPGALAGLGLFGLALLRRR